MKPLGFVTGMVAEARLIHRASRNWLQHPPPLVAVSGARPEKALSEARRLAASGICGLVSFGVSGGLDPLLRPGDLVLGTTVVDDKGAMGETSLDWRRELGQLRLARTLHGGPVAGVDAPVTSVQAKAAIRQAHGAIAVDMESHAVARAATEAGLPFVVLRAIADPADRSVPAAALAGLAADGTRRPFAVAGKLLGSPGELGSVIRLACDSAAAMRSLSEAVAAMRSHQVK